MEMWGVWALFALLMLLLEVFTAGFAVGCLTIGGVAASAAAYFGGELWLQILLFAIFTLLAFIVVRPLVLKYYSKREDKNGVATNSSALVGRVAVVSTSFSDGEGRVSVDGDDWKAVVEEGGEKTIAQGTKVVVTGVDSIILTIKIK